MLEKEHKEKQKDSVYYYSKKEKKVNKDL